MSSSEVAQDNSPVTPEAIPLDVYLLNNELTQLDRSTSFCREVGPFDPQTVAWLPSALKAVEVIPAKLKELEEDSANAVWVEKYKLHKTFDDVRAGLDDLLAKQQAAVKGADERPGTLEMLSEQWMPSFTTILGVLATGTFVALLFIKPRRPR